MDFHANYVSLPFSSTARDPVPFLLRELPLTRARNINIDRGSYRFQLNRSGGNSPRINGRLKFQENDFQYSSTKSYYGKVFGGVRSEPSIAAPINRWEQFEVDVRSTAETHDLIWNQMRHALRIELRNKVRSLDFNAPVAIAERKSTLALITDNAKRLAKAARMIRKGKPAKAVQALGHGYRKPKDVGGFKGPADEWLQIQYGWGPLLSDIHGALVVADFANVRNKPRRVLVGNSETVSGSYETVAGMELYSNLPYPSHLWQIRFPYKVSVERDVRVKVCVDVTPDNKTLATVDQLGITNPALVAWELVPYSFVIDWFVPIGDWISSTPPLWGVSYGPMWMTHVVKSRYDCSLTGKSYDERVDDNRYWYGYQAFWQSHCSDLPKIEGFVCQRSRESLDTMTLPSYDFTYSTSKAITSVSLAIQQLSLMFSKQSRR